MRQQAKVERIVVAPAPAQAATADAVAAQIEQLQVNAGQLELRQADLIGKVEQLKELRTRTDPADRPRLDKEILTAQHDIAAANIELRGTQQRIERLDESRHMMMASGTVQPPPAGRLLGSEQIMQLAGGAAMLSLPFLLILARNLWVRGARRPATLDIESSPLLQRMEQSIEAIAVEVERIGEAQRFTMKVLTDRQPELLANRPGAVPLPAPRREAGSITPH